MAHKTMIGGTIYEVQGGKTLVDGTAYEIQGGKTMVDGTVRDISFGTTHRVTVNSGYSDSTNYGTSCYASVDGVQLEASSEGTVNEVKSDGTLALKVFVSSLTLSGTSYCSITVDGVTVEDGPGSYTLNTAAENISVAFSRYGAMREYGIQAVITTT